MRLNFGCGKNKLDGWKNYDSEVDIRKPLPFDDGVAEYVFAEHVVEHVTSPEAFGFFEESFRVLEEGGSIRITVPCVTQALERSTPEYCNWVFRKGWSKSPLMRDAIRPLIVGHGHQSLWTRELLETCLTVAGFSRILHFEARQSSEPTLLFVEGHGRVIGHVFNEIESISVEGTK